MILGYFLLASLLVASCVSQRPSYAGTRPIGYPTLEETTVQATSSNVDVKLGSVTSTTTERLPIEALGDRRLVESLRKLPLDKQPFWLINWQILEEKRNQPKTYPLKQNSYLHHIPTSRPQPGRFPRLPRP